MTYVFVDDPCIIEGCGRPRDNHSNRGNHEFASRSQLARPRTDPLRSIRIMSEQERAGAKILNPVGPPCTWPGCGKPKRNHRGSIGHAYQPGPGSIPDKPPTRRVRAAGVGRPRETQGTPGRDTPEPPTPPIEAPPIEETRRRVVSRNSKRARKGAKVRRAFTPHSPSAPRSAVDREQTVHTVLSLAAKIERLRLELDETLTELKEMLA